MYLLPVWRIVAPVDRYDMMPIIVAVQLANR